MFLICLICWGKVFCFLHRDGVFDVLEPLKMVLNVLDLLGIVFDVLDQGKRFLLPLPLTEESFDNFMLNCGNLEMSLPFLKKDFFFFYYS